MGTLRVPDIVPSPTQDAERINKAFKGWGTDEKGLIWVLGHRNVSQRRKIRETYEQLYKESLLKSIESELSGDFRSSLAPNLGEDSAAGGDGEGIIDPGVRMMQLANEGDLEGIQELLD